ncbi:hypothetical protein PSN45_002293 [Yamadazyma tenuis]|uniref:uncharacterized protein n=1 Tax=Candida tenuis TaxID=2315449 RepID=UPI00279F83A9|nr:hypothetical protein PSN45_002293 [Yamadazyma tenuis]
MNGIAILESGQRSVPESYWETEATLQDYPLVMSQTNLENDSEIPEYSLQGAASSLDTALIEPVREYFYHEDWIFKHQQQSQIHYKESPHHRCYEYDEQYPIFVTEEPLVSLDSSSVEDIGNSVLDQSEYNQELRSGNLLLCDHLGNETIIDTLVLNFAAYSEVRRTHDSVLRSILNEWNKDQLSHLPETPKSEARDVSYQQWRPLSVFTAYTNVKGLGKKS